MAHQESQSLRVLLSACLIYPFTLARGTYQRETFGGGSTGVVNFQMPRPHMFTAAAARTGNNPLKPSRKGKPLIFIFVFNLFFPTF